MGEELSLKIIDPRDKPKEFFQTFRDCQHIINENLVVNGGMLRQGDLIDRDYNWSHLIIAKVEDKIVGFLLVRFSETNMHDIIDGG